MGLLEILIWLIPETVGYALLEVVIILSVVHGIRKLINIRKKKRRVSVEE